MQIVEGEGRGIPSTRSFDPRGLPLKSSRGKSPRRGRTGTRPCSISSARCGTRNGLIYQEPSDWHAPVRLNLGAVLLQAGRPDEAEAVYWEDLRNNPGTGWSLFGLLQSLKAQGKTDEAELVERRFRDAWKDADITLKASRIGS